METMQKRGQRRAALVLATWQQQARRMQDLKEDLRERVYRFTILRTLKKFSLNRQLAIR